MNKMIAIAAMALALTAQAAVAGERGGDAALGALSGAVVLGPVGAVAGALVGYTAGPSIAQSWGLRRSGSAHYARRSARQETPATPQGTQAPAPAVSQAPPPVRSSSAAAPPVQTLE